MLDKLVIEAVSSTQDKLVIEAVSSTQDKLVIEAVSSTQDKPKKVRINNITSFKKYISKEYDGIWDDFGEGFVISYKGRAIGLKKDLMQKLIDMGYEVSLYGKNGIDITIKQDVKLSVTFSNDKNFDDGVSIFPTMVY